MNISEELQGLRYENAYLRGEIAAYKQFLVLNGLIKDEGDCLEDAAED